MIVKQWQHVSFRSASNLIDENLQNSNWIYYISVRANLNSPVTVRLLHYYLMTIHFIDYYRYENTTSEIIHPVGPSFDDALSNTFVFFGYLLVACLSLLHTTSASYLAYSSKVRRNELSWIGHFSLSTNWHVHERGHVGRSMDGEV